MCRLFRDLTYWLIIFLIVAAFAHQAELVLGLFFWSWAGGSVHQCAGPCVGSGGTLRVSPTRLCAGSGGTLRVSPISSWSSHGPPRCLSRLEKLVPMVPVNTEHWYSSTCVVRLNIHIYLNYRSGCRHCHPSWEKSGYFVQLCHERCKLKINNEWVQNNDSVGCCGQSSVIVPIKCQRNAENSTISLFSLIFRALLTMKFSSSSSSESESCTLLWGSGSDAGLFLPIFLVGNVMATFRTLDLRPRLAGSQFTFWKKIQLVVRSLQGVWWSSTILYIMLPLYFS